jgi:hypothetical protein
MKPSQNSLFKADTRVRSVAESGILGLLHVYITVIQLIKTDRRKGRERSKLK